MEPALRDGDWIVCLPPRRAPRPGDLVVAADPLDPATLLVKRVRAAEDGMLRLASDAPEHKGHFAERAVRAEDVLGIPAFRQWPLRRFGPIAAPPAAS